jgi:hypothetical protein
LSRVSQPQASHWNGSIFGFKITLLSTICPFL